MKVQSGVLQHGLAGSFTRRHGAGRLGNFGHLAVVDSIEVFALIIIIIIIIIIGIITTTTIMTIIIMIIPFKSAIRDFFL